MAANVCFWVNTLIEEVYSSSTSMYKVLKKRPNPECNFVNINHDNALFGYPIGDHFNLIVEGKGIGIICKTDRIVLLHQSMRMTFHCNYTIYRSIIRL